MIDEQRGEALDSRQDESRTLTPWLPSLALTVPLLGAPSATDYAVGAHAELAAGSIPIRVEDSIAPASEAFFELHTGLRRQDPTSTLILRYAPRLFGRYPGTEELGRPLLLHSALLTYAAAPAPRWQLGFVGAGSIGEVAYSNLQAFFPQGTAPLPASSISMMTGSLDATSGYRTSLRNTVTVRLQAGGQRPIGEDEDEFAGLPRFGRYGAELMDEYRLTRADTLIGLSGAQRFESPDFGGWSVYSGEGAWVRRTGPRAQFRLQAGALAASSRDDLGFQVIPTSSASYAWGSGTRHRPWLARVAAGTQGFFDALTFDYRPVAFLTAEAHMVARAAFRSGVQLSTATSISQTPREALLFETISMLELPSVYEISNQTDLLFGARGAWFAPHVSEFSEGDHQVRVLIYIGFRRHEGTGTSRGDWLN